MKFNFFETKPKIEKKEKEKFGINISAVIEFKRHQVPGKTPDGMSADFLTKEGQQGSSLDGQEIKEKSVGAYSSPKNRAQETVDLMLDNVDEDTRVINKKIESLADSRMAGGSSDQRPENKFNVKLRRELDTTANFGELMPLAKKWAEEQLNSGSKLDMYSLIVQWYLDKQKICQEKGVLTSKETAAEISHQLAWELGMTQRFYSGSDVRLINVTHGPKLEPFLKEIVGFNKLEEIGGALKPGEKFEFLVKIDEDKKKTTLLKFRNREYQVDEEKIMELAKEHEMRIKEK